MSAATQGALDLIDFTLLPGPDRERRSLLDSYALLMQILLVVVNDWHSSITSGHIAQAGR